MNDDCVKTNHDERDKYDDVIHSLFFLSAVSFHPTRFIGFSGFAIRWAKLVAARGSFQSATRVRPDLRS